MIKESGIVELHIAGLEALLAAVHADDPKRELLVRIGDAIREARSAATLISELQAERDRLNKRLDLLAVGFGVCDGGKFIADWQTKIAHYKRAVEAESALSRIQSETVEAWQPIETAPKDGTAILLHFPKRYQNKGGISWGCFIDGDWLDSRAIRDNDATHWQPLPKPPPLKLPDYRGGEAKTAESSHSPSTREG